MYDDEKCSCLLAKPFCCSSGVQLIHDKIERCFRRGLEDGKRSVGVEMKRVNATL